MAVPHPHDRDIVSRPAWINVSHDPESTMDAHTRTDEPLLSEFSGDQDMAELVELFVEEMGERIASLERLWNENEIDDLCVIAHQLKGASGGYGFPSITQAAAELEGQIKQGCEAKDELRESFEQLLRLCKRASV
jgi:HPt (histidine-containing phosphotransfer) domain-containing protein